MFAATIRRAYKICDRVIVRNLRGREYLPRGPNPGLDLRLRAFKKDGLSITDEDAEEFVEQSASDFYKAGQAYNDHLKETVKGKDKLQHHIVKEKYFKENMPNLLTWSEKEQIRHLSQEQPDEWTPEKLAESFPVTVPVVKKLLKFVWKPATKERIARHDASVMKNWKELRNGTLSLPEGLQEHFLKFSNRTIPPLSTNSIAPSTEFTKDDKLGEFERIIQRCAAKEKSSSSEPDYETSDQEESKKPQRIRKDAKLVTLNELSNKIKKRLETGKRVDVPDKLLLSTLDSKAKSDLDSIVSHPSEIELSDVTNDEKKLVAFKDEEDKGKDIMNYPERIRIPKKAYKRGATYKVNDCYYDHDGKFLYRVLGMSN